MGERDGGDKFFIYNSLADARENFDQFQHLAEACDDECCCGLDMIRQGMHIYHEMVYNA